MNSSVVVSSSVSFAVYGLFGFTAVRKLSASLLKLKFIVFTVIVVFVQK